MRLIDADELKNILTASEYPCVLQTALVGIVDTQPTAFEVDKVLRALESEVEWYSTHGVNKDVNRGRIEASRTAIEYVKAGGKKEGWKQ